MRFLIVTLLGLQTIAYGQKTDAKRDLRVQNIEEPRAEYNFNPLGEADPFKVPLNSVVRELDKTTKRFSFLQDFPTNQIKVIGTLGKEGDRKAVLSAPNSRSKTVQVGHPIGKSNGYVIAILNEGVRIKEFTFLSDGSKKSRIVELKMEEQDDKSSSSGAAAPPPEPSSDVFKKVYDQLRSQGKDVDEMDTHLEEGQK